MKIFKQAKVVDLSIFGSLLVVCDGFEFLGMNCYATDIHIIQIPPEVCCFRYVFWGVQLPSQELFGCLRMGLSLGTVLVMIGSKDALLT